MSSNDILLFYMTVSKLANWYQKACTLWLYLSPGALRQMGLTEIDGHENDAHEIGGQYIYRLKIDYITMQCAILFKTTAEYKSQQRGKLYRPPVIVFRLSGSFSFSPV